MKYKLRFNFDIKKTLTEFFIIDKSENKNKKDKIWDNYYSEFAVFCAIGIFMITILWTSSSTLCTFLIPQDDIIYNAIYGEPPTITRINEDEVININTASKSELLQLDGIGNKLSERILNYRFENGTFDTIYELLRVDGLTQATLEKIKDRITV